MVGTSPFSMSQNRRYFCQLALVRLAVVDRDAEVLRQGFELELAEAERKGVQGAFASGICGV